MSLLKWFSSLPKKYHIILGLLLTIIIGYVDYVTGYEVRMEILYLLPISYVTWFVGQRIGLLLPILSIVEIYYSDIMAGKQYSSYFAEIWNGAVYLVFYSIVTVLLELRISLQQRENLIEDLDNALRQNEELMGLLPICGNCKKFRDDREYRQKVEPYISKHLHAELARSLCKECAAKLRPESGK